MEPDKPGDFTDLEYWESFFKARKGNPFEWYGEYADFAGLFSEHCGLSLSADQQPPKILIPGCGNSELSASIYDAGFKNIINIDFSKEVIKEMLKKHLRLRPEMKWRVMDMTEMQFPDSSFDIIVDKGGLDALLGDIGQDKSQAIQFLLEVERLVVRNGRYICITLAQSHVIDLLLSTLRRGWLIDIHRVPVSGDAGFKLRPFLVVATRDHSSSCSLVKTSFDATKDLDGYEEQMPSLQRVVQKENLIRKLMMDAIEDESLNGPNATTFENILPGRRASKILIGKDISRSSYSSVVLDAPEGSKAFQYKCAVFLVPKGRRHEWLFSSTEGQWQVVESARANRLIMVFLDTDFYSGSMEVIQDDLSPLVQELLPLDCKVGVSVPYLTCSDGVVKRSVLEEVQSSLTGAMIVENVALKNEDAENSEEKYYRRLAFRRNPNMIQSEALLIKSLLPSKIQKKGKPGKKGSKSNKAKTAEKDDVSADEFQVDHSYLASPYHAVMVAGLSLIASNLENWISSKQMVRAVIIGLGAGLLPMFLHKHIPLSKIEVMELDPVVGDLAKRHFGFIEDERMKLCIGNGLTVVSRSNVNGNVSNGSCNSPKGNHDPLHLLIVDADSEDPSTGMSCPPAEFLEESFLHSARDCLCEGGMLVVNLVARAKAPHTTVPEKLLKVFAEVYSLEVDEDVNRVLFALPSASGIQNKEDRLTQASKLMKLATDFAPWCNGPDLHELAEKLIRY